MIPPPPWALPHTFDVLQRIRFRCPCPSQGCCLLKPALEVAPHAGASRPSPLANRDLGREHACPWLQECSAKWWSAKQCLGHRKRPVTDGSCWKSHSGRQSMTAIRQSQSCTSRRRGECW